MPTDKTTLFITGCSGFIGSHLLRKLDAKKYRNIYCLSRSENQVIVDFSKHQNVVFLKGSVYDFELYRQFLGQSDTVVHLAAVTGKARPGEYFDVNTQGLKFFIDKCERLNVKHFLHMSSIATKFRNISNYFYAQSKKEGEQVVLNSSLKYTILRPTLVLGLDSPVWVGLSRLSRTPFVIVFGDGSSKIQPIHIDNLVDTIILILNENIFLKETYDLGGPEVISIEGFLKTTHMIYKGENPGVIHIPFKYAMGFFRFMEKLFYSATPISSGQLSVFQNDGVIKANRVFETLSPKMKTVVETVNTIKVTEADLHRKQRLAKECDVFSRYLIDEPPTDYVLQKYLLAHLVGSLRNEQRIDYFNRFLLFLATTGPLFAKFADAYASVFSKSCLFRKKLVLLLAILESSFPTCRHFDMSGSSRKSHFYLKCFYRGCVFLLSLIISTVLFMPFHLAFRLISKLSVGRGSTKFHARQHLNSRRDANEVIVPK